MRANDSPANAAARVVRELLFSRVRIFITGGQIRIYPIIHRMNMIRHSFFRRIPLFAAAILLLTLAAGMSGCVAPANSRGTIDRTLKVDGPVHLDITNGSGNTIVTSGQPGEVRIHAEFQLRSWSEHGARQRTSELETNPPFIQDSNFVRVGGSGLHAHNLTIHYTVTAPADTQMRAAAGSGNINVSGIAGPVTVTAGSGTIAVANVPGAVQVTAGSGDVQLASIQGPVQATAGSGDIHLANARGDVRLQTGSGAIQLANTAGNTVASTGSGSINVASAQADLRLRTGSGQIQVTGDPQASTYWDLHASSGNVSLHVSPNASLRFYAKTNSGEINAAIPVVLEGTAGKHALRARIGDGKARVEVETTSGNVALQ